jgi:hypothetical protein
VGVALLCAAGTVVSALAQPRPEPPPAPQCPAGDPLCTYGERRLALDGYSYQMMMLSGGADWSTQFWVRAAQGQVLLSIAPLRGTAYLAVQRAQGGRTDPTPAVRVISYHFAPGDPAVAPSGLSSTLYHYDAASSALVGDEPVVQPIATPEAIRQMLADEGWTLVFPAE